MGNTMCVRTANRYCTRCKEHKPVDQLNPRAVRGVSGLGFIYHCDECDSPVFAKAVKS